MAWSTQFQQTGPPKNAGHPFKSMPLNPDAPVFTPAGTVRDAPYSILKGTPSKKIPNNESYTPITDLPQNDDESKTCDLRYILDKKRKPIGEDTPEHNIPNSTYNRESKSKERKYYSDLDKSSNQQSNSKPDKKKRPERPIYRPRRDWICSVFKQDEEIRSEGEKRRSSKSEERLRRKGEELISSVNKKEEKQRSRKDKTIKGIRVERVALVSPVNKEQEEVHDDKKQSKGRKENGKRRSSKRDNAERVAFISSEEAEELEVHDKGHKKNGKRRKPRLSGSKSISSANKEEAEDEELEVYEYEMKKREKKSKTMRHKRRNSKTENEEKARVERSESISSANKGETEDELEVHDRKERVKEHKMKKEKIQISRIVNEEISESISSANKQPEVSDRKKRDKMKKEKIGISKGENEISPTYGAERSESIYFAKQGETHKTKREKIRIRTNEDNFLDSKQRSERRKTFGDFPSSRRDYEWTPVETPASLVDPRMERERLGIVEQKYTVTSPRISYGENGGLRTGFTYEDRDGYLAIQDKDFCFWFERSHKLQLESIQEIEGDLFEQSGEYALAHCVGADMRMGAGIAVRFKREFGNVPDLLDQGTEEGGVAVLKDRTKERFIYYLVTKSESSGKPTYFSLWRSLCRMREHVQENGVDKLAMPKIGCGLDRLDWEMVKSMIEFIFSKIQIEIRICTLNQDHDQEDKPIKSKLVFEDLPITKIATGTLLLYFTTGDLHQDDIILQMSKRHNFLSALPKSQPAGDIIYYDDKILNYGICGCVVRDKQSDKISFKALKKCMEKIKKMNKEFGCDKFDYVAFQWVDEREYFDELINQKIVTIVAGCLRDVDVYVCKGEFVEV